MAQGYTPQFDVRFLKTLDRVFRINHDLVYIYDLRQEKMLYVNGGNEELLGLTDLEIHALGSDVIGAIVHPRDLQRVAARFRRLIESLTDKVMQFRIRIRHRDGDYRNALNQFMPLHRDYAGRPVTALGSIMDVTGVVAFQKQVDDTDRNARNAALRKLQRNVDSLLHMGTTELKRLHALVGSFDPEKLSELHRLGEPLGEPLGRPLDKAAGQAKLRGDYV